MKPLACLALTLAALCLASPLPAAEPIVATNPTDAGPDFVIQGEYAGTLPTDEGEKRFGVQVIALGEGKFTAIGYTGGLPGDGWDGGDKVEISAEMKDGKLVFMTDAAKAEYEDGELRISDLDGNKIGTFEKVHRQSPTLGAKPPEGAVVLFDGTSPDQFDGGRMTDDKLLMEGVTSKQKFGSFKLHLEFQLSFMPSARGQGRANSGCYMQGRYEVQILDSFGLSGEHNECGGIYTIAKPAVNMCYPPLSWQTYDVDYTAAKFDADGKKVANAKMTVKHNGVVIHKDVELDHATTASPLKEGPEPGPVYLQNHGNPIRFRNIWVVPSES